jgi:hypothetical protein
MNYNYTKKAVQEGAKASSDGDKIFSNPYPNDSQAYRRWERGFLTQKGRNILLSEVPVNDNVSSEKTKKVKTVKISDPKRNVKKK